MHPQRWLTYTDAPRSLFIATKTHKTHYNISQLPARRANNSDILKTRKGFFTSLRASLFPVFQNVMMFVITARLFNVGSR